MSDWTRIGDNDVASFGKHTFRFEATEGYYFVAADETDQSFVQVSHHDTLHRLADIPKASASMAWENGTTAERHCGRRKGAGERGMVARESGIMTH